MGESEVSAERIWQSIERQIAERHKALPTEQSALDVMFVCYERLRDFGWGEAIYCPKDGSIFEIIEAGSTGIFKCHYEGEWPKGRWWVHDAGDLWPGRPTLFRALKDQEKTDAE